MGVLLSTEVLCVSNTVSENGTWRRQSWLGMSVRNRAACSLKTPFNPYLQKEVKKRRKDISFKRGHSFLSSLERVYEAGPAGVSPGLTSCDPGPELQSQEKTWYFQPVQPQSLGLQTGGQAQEPGGHVA